MNKKIYIKNKNDRTPSNRDSGLRLNRSGQARMIGELILGLLGYLLIGLHTSQSVFAQSATRTMTITPPGVAVTLDPGGKAEGTMGVINDSDTPLTFIATIQDYDVQDTHGTPNILPPNTLSNKYSAASWIGVSPTNFTIPPHQRQNLSYYIQTPPNARPGGHYAAVVYTPAIDKEQLSSGAKVYTELGTLFYITINGQINQSALVTKLLGNSFQEYGPIHLLTQITNYGDIHIKPEATINVKDMFGKLVYSSPLVSQNIFPGSARDFQSQIGSTWMIGSFTANVIGTYGTNNNLPLTAVFTFIVFPWKIATIVILIIVVVVLGLLLWKKKKTEKHEENQTNTVENKEVL